MEPDYESEKDYSEADLAKLLISADKYVIVRRQGGKIEIFVNDDNDFGILAEIFYVYPELYAEVQKGVELIKADEMAAVSTGTKPPKSTN